MKRILAAAAVMGGVLLSGCGGGGGGGSVGVLPGNTFTPLPTPQTVTRTFNVNNANNSTFAVVTSVPGQNDNDRSTLSVGVSNTTMRGYHLALHRDMIRQATQPIARSTASYDTSSSLPFFIATTNKTVTVFNRTPGVLGNAGTKPSTCVTFVEQVGGQDVINSTDLHNAISAWEVNNPFNPGTGIIQTMHSDFGFEWGANGQGGGGNDGDPRVVLLFLSTATMGDPGLFGFVDFADELSPQPGIQANSGEIIYLQAQPTSVSRFFQGDGFDGYATLVHELHHLIIFNNKVARQGTFPASGVIEETTIDEGLSTLAEELNGFALSNSVSGGGNSFIFDVIKSYETTAQNTNSFFAFNNQGQDFGKGYLFFKHIKDTLGVSTITAIDEDPNTGSANIANHVGTSFGNEMQTWALANFVSGLSGTTQFTYPDLNMAGTFTLHNNNDPNQALTNQKLPGITPTPVVPVNGMVNTSVDAFAAEFLGLNPGSGSVSITVSFPQTGATSLVQMQGNTVTNVTF